METVNLLLRRAGAGQGILDGVIWTTEPFMEAGGLQRGWPAGVRPGARRLEDYWWIMKRALWDGKPAMTGRNTQKLFG